MPSLHPFTFLMFFLSLVTHVLSMLWCFTNIKLLEACLSIHKGSVMSGSPFEGEACFDKASKVALNSRVTISRLCEHLGVN